MSGPTPDISHLSVEQIKKADELRTQASEIEASIEKAKKLAQEIEEEQAERAKTLEVAIEDLVASQIKRLEAAKKNTELLLDLKGQLLTPPPQAAQVQGLIQEGLARRSQLLQKMGQVLRGEDE